MNCFSINTENHLNMNDFNSKGSGRGNSKEWEWQKQTILFFNVLYWWLNKYRKVNKNIRDEWLSYSLLTLAAW